VCGSNSDIIEQFVECCNEGGKQTSESGMGGGHEGSSVCGPFKGLGRSWEGEEGGDGSGSGGDCVGEAVQQQQQQKQQQQQQHERQQRLQEVVNVKGGDTCVDGDLREKEVGGAAKKPRLLQVPNDEGCDDEQPLPFEVQFIPTPKEGQPGSVDGIDQGLSYVHGQGGKMELHSDDGGDGGGGGGGGGGGDSGGLNGRGNSCAAECLDQVRLLLQPLPPPSPPGELANTLAHTLSAALPLQQARSAHSSSSSSRPAVHTAAAAGLQCTQQQQQQQQQQARSAHSSSSSRSSRSVHAQQQVQSGAGVSSLSTALPLQPVCHGGGEGGGCSGVSDGTAMLASFVPDSFGGGSAGGGSVVEESAGTGNFSQDGLVEDCAGE